MKVLHEDCDPTLADDKSLPTSAFLVEYIQGETTHYDIVSSGKKVDIFDYYYDRYKKDLVNITQAEGRINPKLWGNKPTETKKKR
tara:strand:+ start:2721 stop:2975 length:255 start_codon:yes stop_codon:yes gene_type:complete